MFRRLMFDIRGPPLMYEIWNLIEPYYFLVLTDQLQHY
jgi:hypothetical protein